MRFFEKLADRVAELANEGDLQSAACRALAEMPPNFGTSPREVIEWVSESKLLPTQVDVDANFGEPPVVVVHRENFYIQVLFWRDGTTQIHQHRFSRAFSVLSGSSSHVEYSFDVADASDPHFVTGRLRHLRTEFLKAGDCRPIPCGPALIHSLFHLESPSVSVVIRSHTNPKGPPQLSYGPTLGINPFRTNDEDRRKLQILELLLQTESESVDRQVDAMLSSSGIAGSYRLLEHLARHQKGMAGVREHLPVAKRHHGARVDAFEESLADMLRIENINARRKAIRHKDHRSLLALLLTVPRLEDILQAASQLRPEDDPASFVCQCLREMACEKGGPEWGPNALGIELDDLALKFLEQVIRGYSADDAASMVGDEHRGQLLALTLPRTSLLRGIFS